MNLILDLYGYFISEIEIQFYQIKKCYLIEESNKDLYERNKR